MVGLKGLGEGVGGGRLGGMGDVRDGRGKERGAYKSANGHARSDGGHGTGADVAG